MPNKKGILKELTKIPGVGKSIAIDLWGLNIRYLEDIKNKDAQILYDKLYSIRNSKLDRCMLYVFRRAIYFVNEKNPNPNLLKWWNWKD